MKVRALIVALSLGCTLATVGAVCGRLPWLARQSSLPAQAAEFEEANRRLVEDDAWAPFPPPAVLESQLARVPARGNGPGRSVQPTGPAITSTLVAFVGFAMWVGSTVLLVRRGVEGRFAPRGFRHGGRLASGWWLGALLPVMLVLGFALFVAGLRST